jgi:carbamoyl-phosphate synthase small subunit
LIGYQGEATGEVCFNTSLTGYQEIISDPSYAGQIINFTFPHIGNVGTNNEDYESDKIWTKGVIFNSEITSPSNYRSFLHLDAWLKKNKIVGITGLDTRSLTNFIRDKGAPKGTIAYSKTGKFNISKLTNLTIKWSGLKNLDLAEKVTTSKNYIWKGLKTWKKEKGFEKNKKTNSLVLGEGAAVFCLEKDKGQHRQATIQGFGFSTELIEHNVSLSAEAECLKEAMKMALKKANLETVDSIVMHAPGTLKGDESEYKAILHLFGEKIPHLISTKYTTGHTFGASGAISIELAILMLKNKKLINLPYESLSVGNKNKPTNIMVNATGFGGNAVSIILSK